MTEKLFLIDAMAMIYRAYFALISRPLMTRAGKNTSAVYGFVATLLKIIEEEKPDHLAVCFDTEKPTFRHNIFPSYKAQRQEIPTDMPWQIQKIKEIIKSLNISLLEVDGYEADDIIGTLCKRAESENVLSYMVTPDKDFMQLVSEKTFQYKPSRNVYGTKTIDPEIIDKEAVINKFGVPPERVVDVLGLMGDASDNIPGVRGVGEKTAVALIQEFGSIENLYANLDKLTKEKLKETLLKYKDDAFLSKKLVTINTNVPVDINFHELKIGSFDMQKINQLFEELEFKELLKKIQSKKQINRTTEPSDKRKFTKDEIKITIKATKIEPEKVEVVPEVKPVKKLKDILHTYHTIKNHKEYEDFIELLKKQPLFAFDTETDSLDVMNINLIGFSVSFKENEAYYIPIHGEFEKKKVESGGLFIEEETPLKKTISGIEINYAIKLIKPLLESKEIKKVGHNIKFDYLVMKNYGVEINNIFFDSLVGAYILRPESNYDMDTLSYQYLNYEPIHIEELISKGKNQISMSEVPLDKVSEYAAEDADVTLKLYNKLKYELKKISLYNLCSEIEFPLIKVLAEMEYEGVKVDTGILSTIDILISEMIKVYEEKIYKSAGLKFNINSTQQLSKILFDELKLVPPKKTKTGFSTDISVLEDLRYQHEICGFLIEYRGLTKLKYTYIDGLKKAINPKTKRVHTSFIQTGTSTGRLASANPNLQNIPVRSELGKKIRKAFVSRNEDYLIMSADYSQIELRIMAHYSDDENMIRAFKRKLDIHTETAKRIFGVEEKKDVTPGMRRKAKEVNFGIMYGIGVFGLASRLEIKNSEAKDIIDRYFKEYPKVKEYVENTKKFARENGYVQTLTGRRRYLPQINNQNATARAEDERAAINMPIQGTAADMIKIAMIKIFNALKENNLTSKLILQVHDELVLEVKKDELEQVKEIVRENMMNALKLNVPIEVEIGIGKDWFDAH